ncbi:Potassium transport 1 [Lecanosticta acicola]|uniref:Potassium transport protein n=1 Tax=Lecanosticta acicola TaxID=111012 RepID=A0AAI8YSQ9_9PEZI|nr:Potassium transport 1 [Lecanosticta acicola]
MEKEPWWHEIFAPPIELWQWIFSIFPKNFNWRRPRFNFITIHYSYMILTTICFSIMIFGPGNLPYIDALFFAAGTATQSGLNPVDVNNLYLFQQIVFMLGCCFCTPIFINTIVVFVRLYWFERRFEHIVKEVRANRKSNRRLSFSRSRSRTRTGTIDNRAEKANTMEAGGVRGRAIEVLKDTGKKMKKGGKEEEKFGVATPSASVDATPNGSQSDSSKEMETTEAISEQMATAPTIKEPESHQVSSHSEEPQTPGSNFMGLHPRLHHRGITFADEVNDGNETKELARIPEQRDLSKHIEFLERQERDKSDPGTIYIPGPRDFDRGEVPKRLNTEDAIRRLHSRDTLASGDENERRKSVAGEDDQQAPLEDQHRTAITIAEPEHPGHHDRNEDRPSTADAEKNRRSRRFSFSEGTRNFSRTLTNLTKARSSDRPEDPMPYLSWTATTGRNSAFLGLSAEQREELGGIEYRALKTLAGILICYYVGFHILGLLVLLPWIVRSPHYKDVLMSQGQSPGWWGVFTPASMFNDLGFTITNDSMVSFQTAGVPLLFGSFLIVIGNTGFPVMLRFIIWILCKIERLRFSDPSEGSRLYQELRFLLDHPRRCFTLLFPSKATWWLFWVLVLLNGIDLIFFVILDLNDPVVEDMTGAQKVLNGWFQAVSTRTAGFSSVNLAQLHAAIQVSYLIMMYISVFPIAISVRRTNVYEEKSLGIFGGEEDSGDGDQSYVSQHLRRQLSFDLWFIFLGLFIIAIVEGDRIANTNEPSFTTFSVLFEIVSAYGTVGLSLGYDNTNASFSAQFRTLSKLVIIAMMIRGRHRGLPYALDRAILLPSEKLQQKEAEDADRRVARRGSIFAEGQNEVDSSRTWEDGDLDENGLPIQHTGRMIDPMTEGAGGDGTTDGLRKLNTRRSAAGVGMRLNTNQTQASTRGKTHQRNRSLSRVVFGGLGAGPTFPKQE